MMTTKPPDPLRTQSRLFEPQLSNAFGWLLAMLLALGGVIGGLPPEPVSLVCAAVGLLLLLRLLAGNFGGKAFAYLVWDRQRNALYLAAITFAFTTAIVAFIRGRTLPACAPVESISTIGLSWLGNYHVADLAVATVAAMGTVMEPLLFRRTLAVQFLWPSSAGSYWLRWATRLLGPALLVMTALGLHRATAPTLWGPHVVARGLAHELTTAHGSAQAARQMKDERVVTELVTIAMCQPDDELAKALVNTMQERRRRVGPEIWGELEDYVYRQESSDD
jgi:hypothetical protein